MQKTLIITGGGIGDIVCLIPLLRRLRSDGHLITLVYFGADPIHELLDDQQLIDELHVRPNKWALIRFCISRIRFFEGVLLTHLCRGRIASAIAFVTARKVIRSQQVAQVPEKHEIIHYQECFYGDKESSQYTSPSIVLSESKGIDKEYVLVQPFAGNGKAPHKQWDPAYWPQLLSSLSERFPTLTWVIVGEKGEQATRLFDPENKQVEDWVGKTSLRQLRNLAAYCKGYVGVDTGLIHLVAAFDHPTLTIFGGSNHKRFGYEVMDANRHRVIRQEMPCHPCNDWFQPNRSKVSDPSACSDFCCIRTITVDQVLSECMRTISQW
ncbi:MAG: glycosyltransferase family 9 protein [Bacteroidota bacterium]